MCMEDADSYPGGSVLILYLDPDLKICPNLEPRLQYEILKTVKNTSRFVLKNYSLTKIFRQTKKKMACEESSE